MITRQIRGICLLTFFLGVFILGIFIYQDYGISWDERVERLDGIAALNHAIKEFNLILYDVTKRCHSIDFVEPIGLGQVPHEPYLLLHLLTELFALALAGLRSFHTQH